MAGQGSRGEPLPGAASTIQPLTRKVNSAVEVSTIATRAVTRANAQRVRAHYQGPGRYLVHSKSGQGWYVVTAAIIPGRSIRVVCDCKGGTAYRDQHGSSCCKHGAAVAKRLLRRKAERLAVAA